MILLCLQEWQSFRADVLRDVAQLVKELHAQVRVGTNRSYS